MSRKVWDFDEWFVGQHGKRPGGDVTDEEMIEIVRRGDFYSALYRERCEWDNRRTSALYAWQIPDSSKPADRRRHSMPKRRKARGGAKR